MRTTAIKALGVFASIIGFILLAQLAARADDWPQRNVRVITSFPVGTGADIAARLYAERLAQRWGKPVFVENRPGADGIIAVTAVLDAHDNHTLLFTNGGPVTTNSFSHDKLPYDAARDLVPISQGADVTIAISTPASLNINTLADFVAFARAHPATLNWGATPGALDYIVPSFLKNAGLDLVHVSYKEATMALQDLSEARIHLYVSALATQLGLIKSGKLKVLAVTNRTRSALVADTPTASELGFNDLSLEGFLGFFGTRDMPKNVLDRVGADVRAVGSDPAINARLASSGLIARTGTATELRDVIEGERSKVEAFARTVDNKTKQ